VKKICVVLGIILVGATAVKAQVSGVVYERVVSVQVKDDNFVVISVVDSRGVRRSLPQYTGCGNAFGEFKFPITDERTKAWLRIAMASLITHTKVYVRADGCAPVRPGVGGAVSIVGIGLCKANDNQCP